MSGLSASADARIGRLRQGVAFLSVIAPFLHRFLSSAAQAEQWLFNGLIFGAVLLQGLFGLALLIAPWRYDARGNVRRDRERRARPYYRFGVASNVLVLVLYLLAQTIGAPAGETLAPARFLLNVQELVLILGFLVLLRRSRDTRVAPVR